VELGLALAAEVVAEFGADRDAIAELRRVGSVGRAS
jgi:hypothetical protein